MELLSSHFTPPDSFFLENHWVFHHPQTNNPTITMQWHTNLLLLGESRRIIPPIWTIPQFDLAHVYHSQVITRAVNKALRPLTPSTPTIKPTNPTKVQHHINSLKPRTAPGNYGISTVMLWHLPTCAIQHLTHLFNSILQLGYFPTIWKAAKVIPNHKSNKPPTDANSYHPVSLLNSISKLLERTIASRLTTFVNQNHLIPDTQFGFRKKHSTVSQLDRIVYHISHGYNLRKHTGMALLDLEKANS